MRLKDFVLQSKFSLFWSWIHRNIISRFSILCEWSFFFVENPESHPMLANPHHIYWKKNNDFHLHFRMVLHMCNIVNANPCQKYETWWYNTKNWKIPSLVKWYLSTFLFEIFQKMNHALFHVFSGYDLFDKTS